MLGSHAAANPSQFAIKSPAANWSNWQSSQEWQKRLACPSQPLQEPPSHLLSHLLPPFATSSPN